MYTINFAPSDILSIYTPASATKRMLEVPAKTRTLRAGASTGGFYCFIILQPL